MLNTLENIRMSCNIVNWNGYDGLPISDKVLENTKKIIAQLESPVKWELFPTGRNSIQLEKSTDYNEKYIELEIFEDKCVLLIQNGEKTIEEIYSIDDILEQYQKYNMLLYEYIIKIEEEKDFYKNLLNGLWITVNESFIDLYNKYKYEKTKFEIVGLVDRYGDDGDLIEHNDLIIVYGIVENNIITSDGNFYIWTDNECCDNEEKAWINDTSDRYNILTKIKLIYKPQI